MLSYKLKSLLIIFFFALQPFCIFGDDDDDTEELNEKINTILAQTPDCLSSRCLMIVGDNVYYSDWRSHNDLCFHLTHSRHFQVTRVHMPSTSAIRTLSNISGRYDVIIISAHGNERFLDLGNQEEYAAIIANLENLLTDHLTENGIFILSSCGLRFYSAILKKLRSFLRRHLTVNGVFILSPRGQSLNTLRSEESRIATDIARLMHPTQMFAYATSTITDLRPTNGVILRFMYNEQEVPMHVLSGTRRNNEEIPVPVLNNSREVAIRPTLEYRDLQFIVSLILFYMFTTVPFGCVI